MKKIEDWKVLFIDDDQGIRKVMSVTLEDVGYNMLTAADGESGIELCREHSPQIVITDIRMPGMDGIEVLKSIKETDPDKEVIVTTAYGEIEYAIQALQLGSSDFITKPINDDALHVALERAKKRYTTQRKLKEYTAFIEERWMDTSEELAYYYGQGHDGHNTRRDNRCRGYRGGHSHKPEPGRHVRIRKICGTQGRGHPGAFQDSQGKGQ